MNDYEKMLELLKNRFPDARFVCESFEETVVHTTVNGITTSRTSNVREQLLSFRSDPMDIQSLTFKFDKDGNMTGWFTVREY